MLYAKSIQLSDKGFGSQERCLNFITAFKGNMKEAEKVLSSIMFNEAKEDDEDDKKQRKASQYQLNRKPAP